jgi:hypothetical protein
MNQKILRTKDCYDRVTRLFSPEKYKIIKFNAFGRIDNNPKSSSNLKQFYKKYFGSSSKINTDFKLEWAFYKKLSMKKHKNVYYYQ